jgi:hypothetical protein
LVGKVAKRVVRDIDRVFGVDVSQVPTYVLDKKAFERKYAKTGGRTGGRSRFLMGFEYRGRVYLRNALFKVNREIITHELLHAVSTKFSLGANAIGQHHLLEGVTDYLTHKIVADQGTGRLQSSYRGYERFVAHLARGVGDKFLAECYFHGSLSDLLDRASRVFGQKRIVAALDLLAKNRVDRAIEALGQ